MGLLNIVYQIDASEHHASGEQYVLRNIDGDNIEPIIVPYADLASDEKTEYDELKAVYDGLLPEGKNACMIAIQIDLSEHNSEERAVICYDDDGEMKRVFKTYASLTAGQKTKYDAFKTQAEGKVPE